MKDKRKREGIKKQRERIGKAKSSQGKRPQIPSAIHYHPLVPPLKKKRFVSLRDRCVQHTLALFGQGNDLLTVPLFLSSILYFILRYFFSHDEQTKLND